MAERPPVAIPSLERSLRTTQEYGLSTARYELRHCLSFGRAKIFPTLVVGQKNGAFLVDNAGGQSLYTPQRRAVRLRCDCAPLKLLTGTVNRHPIVLGCTGFAGSSAYRRGGPPWFPGCLKSESEERETWTAESLRAALAWRRDSSSGTASEETSAV